MDTDLGGLDSGARFDLFGRGHFSTPTAEEWIVRTTGCEVAAAGTDRLQLVRRVKHRLVEVVSTVIHEGFTGTSVSFRTTHGRTLLVGTWSRGKEGLGYTHVKVLGVRGDEFEQHILLATRERDPSYIDPPGTTCFKHSVDAYVTQDVDGDGVDDLVVTTSERAGVIKLTGRWVYGEKERVCALNPPTAVHSFRFLFDGSKFRPDDVTRKWIDAEAKRCQGSWYYCERS
jgi:hypothetical protein